MRFVRPQRPVLGSPGIDRGPVEERFSVGCIKFLLLQVRQQVHAAEPRQHRGGIDPDPSGHEGLRHRQPSQTQGCLRHLLLREEFPGGIGALVEARHSRVGPFSCFRVVYRRRHKHRKSCPPPACHAAGPPPEFHRRAHRQRKESLGRERGGGWTSREGASTPSLTNQQL